MLKQLGREVQEAIKVKMNQFDKAVKGLQNAEGVVGGLGGAQYHRGAGVGAEGGGRGGAGGGLSPEEGGAAG